MMNLTIAQKTHVLLLRRSYALAGTNGTLTYQGRHICHTIELPDRDNERNKSCIPEGRYKLCHYNSKRFPNAIGISGVPNRSAILFHTANYAPTELKGCIAPVTSLTAAGKGTQSANALKELTALVNCLWDMGGEVYLLIK